MTMVGYGNSDALQLLPKIKPSVLERLISEDPDVQLNQDIRYARYYSPMLDLDWIFRNANMLDSKYKNLRIFLLLIASIKALLNSSSSSEP
jgi:hypothetical protein